MNRTLAQAFPHVYCELDFTNPLELTVATILSAQSTDKRVNLTTPALFKRYRTALDYAQADRTELEEMIRPTGFYRNKANSLIGLGQELVERFDGQVPATMEELVTLPGVGRKTANVILGNAFDIPGITVDTHFGRLVRRWRWTAEEDPVKVEHAVGELIERSEWTLLSHRVIFHGRRVCHARQPGVRGVRAGQGLPVVRHRAHRPADRGPLVKGPETDHLLALAGPVTSASSMSTSTRWTVAVLVVVVALVVALFTQLRGRRHANRDDRARPRPATTATPTPPRRWPDRGPAPTCEPCPPAGAGAGSGGTARHHPGVRGRRVDRRRRTGRGRARGRAEPVGVLVRAVRGRTARDGRVPAAGRARRDGADRASGRERDRRVAAAGRARRAVADAAGRSAAGRRRAERAQRDARDGGTASGR